MVGKRIALFHNLPSGGAKRALYEWCKRLSENNHIDFYGYDHNHNYLDITAFTQDKFTFKKPKNKIHLFYINYLIAGDIDKKKYDFVFIHHDELLQSPAVLFFLKTKKIYYCQEPSRRDEFPSSGFLGKIKDYLIIKLDKINARKSDLILCNSTYSKIKIFKRYNKEAVVSPLGVSDRFLRKSDYKIIEPVKILAAGRLHTSKGYEFLIKALSLLKFNFKLYILSDSSDEIYKNYLNKIADKNKIEIEFKSLSEEELVSFYSYCDIFCATQIKEPFGLVILEAMSSGLPVIAINEGGFLDIIQNRVNGLLVERREHEYAKAVMEIYTNSELRIKLSLETKNTVENWSWSNSFKKLNMNILNVL